MTTSAGKTNQGKGLHPKKVQTVIISFISFSNRFHSKIASGHYAQVKSIRQLHSRFPLESNSNAGSHLFADAMQDTTAEIRLREANYNPEDVLLLRSPDPVKDQSYFLCNLSQAQLRRCLFPIGHLQKSEVRRLAETFDLPTKHRRDSQGICFLGKLKFDDFIEHYLGQHPGVIRSVDTGQELGQHRGLWFHTLGQRKGLGTLMKSGTVNYGPWYVCAKDMRSNTLFVSNVTHARSDNPTYVVEEVNWINGMPRELFGEEASACAPGTPQAQVAEKVTGTGSGLHVYMKLRHSPTLVEGYIHRASSTPLDNHSAIDTAGSGTIDSQSTTISLNSHIRKRTNFSCCGSTRNSVVVRLQDSSESVAPGQFVAFYQGEVCIGSGVVADLPAPAAES